MAKLGSKSGSIRADQAEVANARGQPPNTGSIAYEGTRNFVISRSPVQPDGRLHLTSSHSLIADTFRIRVFSADQVANQPVINVAARTRVWFNPELRSRNYFVPGVAANIL